MSRHTVDEALGGAHDDRACETNPKRVIVKCLYGYYGKPGKGIVKQISDAYIWTVRSHEFRMFVVGKYVELIPVPPVYGKGPAEKCLDGLVHDGLLKPRNESERRKAEPVYSGVLRYFPLALRAVARLSKKGNDKHNPGEPLHWSRDKSTDHGDCIVRHQLEPEAIDPETGETHAVAVAWRALAQLELLEEKRLGK